MIQRTVRDVNFANACQRTDQEMLRYYIVPQPTFGIPHRRPMRGQKSIRCRTNGAWHIYCRKKGNMGKHIDVAMGRAVTDICPPRRLSHTECGFSAGAANGTPAVVRKCQERGRKQSEIWPDVRPVLDKVSLRSRGYVATFDLHTSNCEACAFHVRGTAKGSNSKGVRTL